MKTKKNITYATVVLMAGIRLLPAACTDSYGEWVPEINQKGTYTFSFELPVSKTADLSTRATTDEQEQEIAELTLLLFKEDQSNTERLESTLSIPRNALIQNPTNPRLYTTTATLEPGTYSNFVVLANSADALSSQSALLAEGTSRNQIEEGLLLSLDDGAQWNASQPTPRLFPMWGLIEGGSTGIVINSIPKNLSAKLFRMLASIDLIIEQEDEQGQPLPALKLTQVHLYNFYRNGRMVPISTNTHYDGNKLLDASLPASGSRLPYTGPLVYNADLADPTADPDIVIRREIFTFEQMPSDGAEESDAPFIIMEGAYEDTDYPSFYRLDFVERMHEDPADPLDADNNFLPLVRNYSYSIVVKEILGPGYRSIEDAAKCKPFNTVSEVFRFDDSDSESVQFDGKYFLSVSHEELKYDKQGRSQVFVVKTDSPLGWEISNVTYSGGDGSADWLHLDKTEGSRDDNGEVNITADVYNPTGTNTTPREASFTVTSGRMEFTIQVIQSHLVGISLDILDEDGEPLTEILFRSNPRENPQLTAKNFNVKWSGPAGCEMEVAMLGDRVFPFERTGANAIYTGRTLTAGEEDYTFSITPVGFTEQDTDEEEGKPFLQDGATVTFRVSNGDEEIVKNIYIRHQCISIVFRNLEGFSYMGSEDGFTVHSNTAWELINVEPELTNLFLTTQNGDFSTMEGTRGGYNTMTGSEFIYRVQSPTASNGVYSIGRSGRKMALTFRDTEGTISDKTITIYAATPDPNCYMVPGGSSVRIPLRKLFWLWDKEVEIGRVLNPAVSGPLNLSARIVWQTATGLIQNMQVANNGSTDYRDYTLNLTASSTTWGNAIVAIENNNEILWSFHIWVTGYNPNTNGPVFTLTPDITFMDRNLGSNGNHNSVTQQGVGLYYQWGRKDPFPGARELGSQFFTIDLTNLNNQFPVFSATGTTRVYTAFTEVAVVKNLANSIHNPTTYYTSNDNLFPLKDWYSNGTKMKDQNDYLWQDKVGRKSPYDPCPDGWRVSRSEEIEALFGATNKSSQPYWRIVFTQGSNSLIFLFGGTIEENQLSYGTLLGKIWNSNTNQTHGIMSYLDENAEASVPRAADVRKSGNNIRCVRDTHNWYP